MTAPPFDTGAARTLAIVASQTQTAGHTADRAALITTILDACAEVERLRTALATSERSHLLRAHAQSVIVHADAWQRLNLCDVRSPEYAPAHRRWESAQATMTTARTTLDAFERAHGLDLTHPDAAVEPCPGSRGW